MSVRRPRHAAGRVVAGALGGLAIVAAAILAVAAFARIIGCEVNTAGTSIDGCPLSDDAMAAATLATVMIFLTAATAGPVLLLMLVAGGIVCLARRRW